ncbi:unnamed protein product [Rotaria sordida]|uniref:RING-type domain-containing protein n=1 Tax=Rotaria sordida TaxID=392033 RepID=A0A818TJU4_9BILA|nr:unnamed protein product [Rotaria sordida]CAF3684813.1 unnamed protein product [Rotaria sordida]CAF3877999.1 unnamed protein product [Rotaria sordida]
MSTGIENYYEYINEETIDKLLICKTCNKPFIDPVITPCQQTYCRQCIEESWDNNYVRCSSCNETHLKTHLIPVTDPSILTALDQIQVKCKLCDQSNIERGNIEYHINNICQKAIVTCPANEINCPWIGLREELQTHLTPNSSDLLTSNTQIQEKFESTCDKYCILEESYGQFLPFSTIDLQQRQFQNQDIAIAVKALLINKRRTYLDLFNKGITSKSVSIIASVLYNDTLLETLGLRNNLICDTGIQYLAHALSTNSCLQRLDLNNNSITDTGVRLLADMLRTNQTLIKLTLSYNRISNEGMNVLADVLINYNSTLQWLCLVGNSGINNSSTHSIINLIKHNKSLTTLNLEGCSLSWWSKAQICFYQTIYFKSNLNLTL